MSPEPAWDAACHLQGQMFAEVAKIGGLEVQLAYFRGLAQFSHSRWTLNAQELAGEMSRVYCEGGHTQIEKVLRHARAEHLRQPVSAIIFVGDAMEENPFALYDGVVGLPPVFMFQEGNDPQVEQVFKEVVLRTKGAFAKFDSGSARALAELLRAAAAFAAGGVKALADQNTDGARKLLGQMK